MSARLKKKPCSVESHQQEGGEVDSINIDLEVEGPQEIVVGPT